MPTEIWKAVVGYEGFYEVSNQGRVRSTARKWVGAGQIRVPSLARGYPQVNLSVGGKAKVAKVHVLVLTAFRGPRPKGKVSRHLDGNQLNNKLRNLRWGTSKQNGVDKVRHGTSCKGERNGQAKLTAGQARTLRKLAAEGMPVKQLELIYRISKTQIRRIAKGGSWHG